MRYPSLQCFHSLKSQIGCFIHAHGHLRRCRFGFLRSQGRTPEYPFSGQIPIRAKPGRFLRNVTSNPGQSRGFWGESWALNPGNFWPRLSPGPEIRENGRKIEYFGLKTTSPGVFGRKCCLKSGPNWHPADLTLSGIFRGPVRGRSKAHWFREKRWMCTYGHSWRSRGL
jgi:hypothetical protein